MSAENMLVDYVEKNERGIVELTSDLLRFNTTSPTIGEAPKEDQQCQEYVSNLLRQSGFEVDMWEPEIEKLRKYAAYIEGQNFHNRPMVVGRLKGSGRGQSLILNAHLDVVPVDPKVKWKHDPWAGEVENGRIYGRGACDMKAGAAAIIAVAQAIRDLKLDLAGDLLLETVFDEEVNGMGTIACIDRGYKADGAIVPEPSDLDVLVATRGLLWGKIAIEGRSTHAELDQSTGSKAVNAIEKASSVLAALRALETEWRSRDDKKHPLLSTPRIVPTVIKAGDFWATIPDRCDIEIDAQYLPNELKSKRRTRDEIEERLNQLSQHDPWFHAHPPKICWVSDLPPIEIDQNHPLVRTVVNAGESVRQQLRVAGFDSSYDGPHLVHLSGIPTIILGPGPVEKAHSVDEFVTIDSLIKTVKVLCLAAVRWCGTV